MCPVCVANAAMTATSAGSAGGAAALALKFTWRKLGLAGLRIFKKEENVDGNEQNAS